MHQLFITQVYQKKVAFNLKDLKHEIEQTRKSDHDGKKWSEQNYSHGYTSYGSWDQMHRLSSTFAALEKKIDAHVATFVKALQFNIKANSLQMNACWINIMPPNTFHSAHIHPHAVISGSFYVDLPPRASAIKFEDPRLGLFMNAPTIKLKAARQHQRFFSLLPKPSDVVLFESWLKHEVPRNSSRKPRISVSFNYGWK